MNHEKIKLFLVDDDAMFLKLLEIEFLYHADFTIETFATGELCMENISHNPDVIILDYHLDGVVKNAMNGIAMQLECFDASPYDHFEFWVRGDPAKGYTTIFKIEFKKFQKDADGYEETIKGSYVVKGVTDKWQKISIPLNVINGILDWKDLREFVITFEKRRVERPRDGAFRATDSAHP